MRKLSLLLTMLLVTSLGGVTQAKTTQKQITLTFANDDANGITWNAGTNTINDNTLTFSGSWSSSGWTFSTPVNLKGFKLGAVTRNTELTFEFTDNTGKIDYYHFWGTEAIGETNFDLSSMTDGADLTNITKITVNPRAGEAGVYATFSTIAMTIEVEVADGSESADYVELKLEDAQIIEGSPTIDGDKITFNTANTDKYGWSLSDKDLSSYKYLVVVPRRPYIEEQDGQVNYTLTDGTTAFADWNMAWGTYQQRRASVVDLTNHYRWLTSAEENESQKNGGEVADVNTANLSQFYFRGETAGKDYEISAVYFTNQQPTYANMWNATNHSEMSDFAYETTAKNLYRTVCLPYAAAVCGAYAYEVVGVDSKDNPTQLYLKEVNGILQAGKPYIVKSICDVVSSDFKESQITFYKAGSNTVATPQDGDGLVGTFSDNTSVPVGSYILKDGSWLKVVSNNTVNANHAYLTLTDELVVPESAAAKLLVMTLDGNETTGINSINAAGDDAPVYNLSGMRVKNPTRGIYVKNGKKYIVK